MLTLEKVNQRNAEIQSQRSIGPGSDKHNAKLAKSIEAIKPLKLYLETNPSEEFVKKEFKRLTDLAENLAKQYCEDYRILLTPANKKQAYKNAGVPNIEIQISTLKAIIEG